MTSYREFLKRNKMHHSCRWIIKEKAEKITEVKLVYNPKEYKGRKIYTQKKLITILDEHYEKQKTE